MTSAATTVPTGADDFGIAREVVSGVFRVRLPLDLQEDHINTWVLDDGAALTIIDSGLGTRRTQALWENLFERQFAGRALKRVICTHWHPDHMGCAAWLAARAEDGLWATRREWLAAWRAAGPDNTYLADEQSFLRVTGCAPDLERKLLDRAGYITERFLPPPENYRRFYCGELIEIDGEPWQTLLGEGHSPEHAALYCGARNVLITGDMVLPDTTTFVGVDPGDELDADPIDAYLRSLDRLEFLPEDVLVLPSHGEPFRGLHERIAELKSRQQVRLQRMLDAIDGPVSPAGMVAALRGRKPSASQLYLGLRLALAGLNYHCNRRVAHRWQAAGVLQFDRICKP